MNPQTLTQIIGALGVGGIVTVIATYLVARRQSSGRIDTSDAASLWLESQSMRADLRAEVVALRAEVVALRAEVQTQAAMILEFRIRLARREEPTQ